jgi:hypothetical protein
MTTTSPAPDPLFAAEAAILPLSIQTICSFAFATSHVLRNRPPGGLPVVTVERCSRAAASAPVASVMRPPPPPEPAPVSRLYTTPAPGIMPKAPRLARRTDGSSVVTPDNKAYASQDLHQRGQGVGGGEGPRYDDLSPVPTAGEQI